MNKNRIEGRHGASRWHNTPKTTGMPVEVNAAAVQQSNVSLPGEICAGKPGQKSAEVVVIGYQAGVRMRTAKMAGTT